MGLCPFFWVFYYFGVGVILLVFIIDCAYWFWYGNTFTIEIYLENVSELELRREMMDSKCLTYDDSR